MIASEFIIELMEVRTLFDWKLVPDASITPERRARARLHIRATSKDVVGGVQFDPIGAVCYVRTGLAFGDVSWMEAARALDLVEADAWQIMAASNDLTWRQVGELRGPHPQLRALRSELAAAVGLENQIPDPDPGFVWL